MEVLDRFFWLWVSLYVRFAAYLSQWEYEMPKDHILLPPRLYIPSRDRDVAKQLREELESRLLASGDDEDMQGTDTSMGPRP